MAPPFLSKRRYDLSLKAVVPTQHVTEDFDTLSDGLLITSLFRQGCEVLFRLEQGGTRGYFTKRL